MKKYLWKKYLWELDHLSSDLYECFEVEAITKNNDNVFVEYSRNQSINYSIHFKRALINKIKEGSDDLAEWYADEKEICSQINIDNMVNYFLQCAGVEDLKEETTFNIWGYLNGATNPKLEAVEILSLDELKKRYDKIKNDKSKQKEIYSQKVRKLTT